MYDFINGWHVRGEKGWDHHHSGSNAAIPAIPTSAPNVLIPLWCRDEISELFGGSKTINTEIYIAIYYTATQWLK